MIDAEALEAKVYDANWVLRHATSPSTRIAAEYTVSQIVKLDNVRRILDIGCASGYLVNELRMRGYFADGLDTSRAAINYAQSNMAGSFYCTTVNDFYPHCKYELVVMTHVLEHFDKPIEFLNGIQSLIKRGSYVYVAVPNLDAYEERSIWRKQLKLTIWDNEHKFYFNPPLLKHTLEIAGFKNVRIFTKTYGWEMALYSAASAFRAFTRTQKVDHAVVDAVLQSKAMNIACSSAVNKGLSINAAWSQRSHRGVELIAIGVYE